VDAVKLKGQTNSANKLKTLNGKEQFRCSAKYFHLSKPNVIETT